jgi:hypothetical protein
MARSNFKDFPFVPEESFIASVISTQTKAAIEKRFEKVNKKNSFQILKNRF